MSGEINKTAYEARLAGFRRACRVRREEQDRIGDHIEQLLYEAKGQEAIDVLVNLAGRIFDPVKR